MPTLCLTQVHGSRMSLHLQPQQATLVKDWGKRGERIGEAKNSCGDSQRGGAATPKITASFCKSSSTWKWSTNVSPRSFGANRSIPGKALQAWTHSHGGEFTEESRGTLHALQEALTPRAKVKRRPKSAPPLSAPSTSKWAYGYSHGLQWHPCATVDMEEHQCSTWQSMSHRKAHSTDLFSDAGRALTTHSWIKDPINLNPL